MAIVNVFCDGCRLHLQYLLILEIEKPKVLRKLKAEDNRQTVSVL